MPCPICNHTMSNLGVGRRVFWCPRCGTVKTESGDHVEYESPRLVSRAEQLVDAIVNKDDRLLPNILLAVREATRATEST